VPWLNWRKEVSSLISACAYTYATNQSTRARQHAQFRKITPILVLNGTSTVAGSCCQGFHAVLKVLKKYWIVRSVFKTLKKYWIQPKYIKYWKSMEIPNSTICLFNICSLPLMTVLQKNFGKRKWWYWMFLARKGIGKVGRWTLKTCVNHVLQHAVAEKMLTLVTH